MKRAGPEGMPYTLTKGMTSTEALFALSRQTDRLPNRLIRHAPFDSFGNRDRRNGVPYL
jgi:hypothetical protein